MHTFIKVSFLLSPFIHPSHIFQEIKAMNKNKHLVHGILNVTIYEIDRLNYGGGYYNLCPKTANPQNLGKRVLSSITKLLLCRPEVVGSKLYATVDLDGARVGRTRMIENEPSNPRWYESFRIYCAHTISNIVFTVKNANPISATLIGRAYLPVEQILRGRAVDTWIQIMDEEGDPISKNSRIHISVGFSYVSQDKNWSQGIKSPLFEGVPYTFFNQREGCKITLYQDAHILDSTIPKFILSSGKVYEPNRCWEDVYDAITNAKHLIYIAGWSVYTKITLVRDTKRPRPQGIITLGELLIKKADEGVRVLMLVWDDRTSSEPFKRDGLMSTHDEETADYFRNTNVHCYLCPRNPGAKRSYVQGFEVSTMFTHHQKTIIVDSEAQNFRGLGQQKRRIVSFVGGIDLCDGRYDTPDHSLFRTLDTTHLDDFHQPNFTGSSIQKGGPREPWHDIHCKLEGPVAWDVLYNFEQRWNKQVGNEYLYTMEELNMSISRPSPATLSQDPDTWKVQIFRSIDNGAANGFPNTPAKAAKIGLISGKDNIIDRSIQDAYINAIRRAKSFIYIENQYFLGSSYGWKSNDIRDDDIGALHLIPKELSLKIISKIEAGERFTVYVVIPMWPEGIPESESVQAILDWQRRTMEMMYKDIAQAIQVKGLNADVRDYLTFFCLGNREIKKMGEYTPVEKPEPESDYSRAQMARRFMIYVHAKMMIVDDEYIIIGSANINQRSMEGSRDSEIAMGAFQPYHLATNQPARGQIYGFRMALWYEHLGEAEGAFLHPESLECVREVNKIADINWEKYTSESSNEDLRAHLLRYPVSIIENGSVSILPGFEFFPDTKARVLGKKAEFLPPILTT